MDGHGGDLVEKNKAMLRLPSSIIGCICLPLLLLLPLPLPLPPPPRRLRRNDLPGQKRTLTPTLTAAV